KTLNNQQIGYPESGKKVLGKDNAKLLQNASIPPIGTSSCLGRGQKLVPNKKAAKLAALNWNSCLPSCLPTRILFIDSIRSI
ncbi:hypothetical protein ACE6ED_28665, partial [Paenibacillus sp. CN-4]|uniref:hypothetical protein n=1 Tax=Paenibacillus nanchangensis TaxID=3348343 RepID=UPI00397CC5C0